MFLLRINTKEMATNRRTKLHHSQASSENWADICTQGLNSWLRVHSCVGSPPFQPKITVTKARLSRTLFTVDRCDLLLVHTTLTGSNNEVTFLFSTLLLSRTLSSTSLKPSIRLFLSMNLCVAFRNSLNMGKCEVLFSTYQSSLAI